MSSRGRRTGVGEAKLIEVAAEKVPTLDVLLALLFEKGGRLVVLEGIADGFLERAVDRENDPDLGRQSGDDEVLGTNRPANPPTPARKRTSSREGIPRERKRLTWQPKTFRHSQR